MTKHVHLYVQLAQELGVIIIYSNMTLLHEKGVKNVLLCPVQGDP